VKASGRDVSSEFVLANVGTGLVAAAGQSGDPCFDQVLTDTAVQFGTRPFHFDVHDAV